jgi:oxygen-dependent protoporphyrinogen oxidase
MYTLLGSHEYLHRSWDRPDEELLQDAINCAQGYHGGDIAGELEEYKIVRWDEVVPVIDTGRFGVIAQFKRGVTNTSRVQLASDLDRIPGVNGALVSGIEAAARITTGSADWSTTVAMPASLAGS